MIVENREIRLKDYSPHNRNYNRHPAQQIERIAKSLQTFDQVRSVVVWRNYFLAGHGVREAALLLGWDSLRADVLPDDYPEELALAYVAADNELGRLSDPDQAQLAEILTEARAYDEQLLAAIGYDDREFEQLLQQVGGLDGGGAGGDAGADTAAQVDRAEELGAKWDTADGQIWRIGDHVVICGDCREPDTWQCLLHAANVDTVNGVFTSPPYAMQRKDQYGGVPTDQYVDWWESVQANVKAHLAADGSFFVNIKEHCEDGQRVLYCMDLVCAMVRRWGWRFEDEFAWVHGGTPMDVERRFKNGFEPIYHFSLEYDFRFNPESVRHESGSVPGKYADKKRGRIDTALSQGVTGDIFANPDSGPGMAYPSNALPMGKNSEAWGQSAAFPVALPDFFIRAYSDPGDIWLDPFLGSGTTIVAAHNNNRRGLGIEKLPKYLGVILERLQTHTGIEPRLIDG